jgi:replicative DNA helicase
LKYNPAELTAPEIENAVLSAAMTSIDDLHIIADLLNRDCFYTNSNSKIYTTCIELYNKGKTPDIISVSEALKGKVSLDNILDITSSNSLNIEEHCFILKEYQMRRELLQAHRMIDKVYDREVDVFDVLSGLSKLTDTISRHAKARSYYDISEVIHNSLKAIEKASTSTSSITGIPTGFRYLDRLNNGFNPGELIILAARPGMGKTTLALNFMTTAALNGYRTLLFSIEMGATEIGYKLISSLSEIDHDRLKRGKLTDEEWRQTHTDISPIVNGGNIIIDDSAALDVYQLRTISRKLNHENKLSMIVVDYIQLIQGQDRQNKQQNREQQIAYISRQLKVLAKELELPVICVSQLSRAVESRADKTPMLSDLRESGAIEQDADQVIFIYREAYYNKNSNNLSCKVLLAKNRHGETGSVDITFRGELCKFTDNTNENFGL